MKFICRNSSSGRKFLTLVDDVSDSIKKGPCILYFPGVGCIEDDLKSEEGRRKLSGNIKILENTLYPVKVPILLGLYKETVTTEQYVHTFNKAPNTSSCEYSEDITGLLTTLHNEGANLSNITLAGESYGTVLIQGIYNLLKQSHSDKILKDIYSFNFSSVVNFTEVDQTFSGIRAYGYNDHAPFHYIKAYKNFIEGREKHSIYWIADKKDQPIIFSPLSEEHWYIDNIGSSAERLRDVEDETGNVHDARFYLRHSATFSGGENCLSYILTNALNKIVSRQGNDKQILIDDYIQFDESITVRPSLKHVHPHTACIEWYTQFTR